ncbi:MAG: hypothetical protein EZS28_056338, partial [Streblomastix strix]
TMGLGRERDQEHRNITIIIRKDNFLQRAIKDGIDSAAVNSYLRSNAFRNTGFRIVNEASGSGSVQGTEQDGDVTLRKTRRSNEVGGTGAIGNAQSGGY